MIHNDISYSLPNDFTPMQAIARLALCFFALINIAVAQGITTLTVDVNCTSQTQTDDKWEVEVTVTDPAGNPHTVVVNVQKHSDAKMMTAAIAKKFNALFKMRGAPRFTYGEISNPCGEVSKRTAEDVSAPDGYKFKSVKTRKNHPTDTGADNFLPANDHMQIFNGSTKIN